MKPPLLRDLSWGWGVGALVALPFTHSNARQRLHPRIQPPDLPPLLPIRDVIDRLVRPNIGDLVREDVGPVFLNQASLLSFGPGCFIDAARLLALLDLAIDQPFTDPHFQCIDGSTVRHGEDVSFSDPLKTLAA